MEKLQLEFPPDNAPLVIVGGFLTRNSTAYWGDIDQYFTERDGNARRIIIAPVGACSSVHDRACEIYYSLMGGGRVDYGAEHAMAHKHGRYGRKYPVGLYPQWSVDHPVHFVSHSLGGPTVLKLISLLRTGFFNRNRSSREHHRHHHRHNIFHHHHHHHHHEQDEVDSTSSDSLLTSPTCHPAMVRSLLAFAGPFQGTPSVYLLGAPYNANETTLRSFSIGNFLAKYIHISSFLTPLVGGATTTKKAGEGEGEDGNGNGNGLISGLGEYDGWDWQGDSRNLGMFDGGLFEPDTNHRHATSGADGMSMHSKRSANTALSKRPQRSWRAFKRSVGTLWTQLRKSDWADSSDSGSYDAGLYAADFRERAGENMVCPQVFYASFTGSVTYKHSDSDHHRPDRSFRGDLFVYIMAKMMGSFSYKLDPVPEFLYRKEDPAELERERERLRVEEEEKQAKRMMEKRKSKERRRLSALLIMPTVVLNHSRTSLDEFTSFTSSGSTAIVSGPAPASASGGTMVMMTNNNSSQDGHESLDGHGSESSLSLPATTTTTPSMEIVPATLKSTTLSNPPPPAPISAPAPAPAPTTTTSSSSSSSSVLILSPAELLKIKLKKKARRESMMNRRSTMTSPPSVEPIAEESSPVSYTMPGSWPIPTPTPTSASAEEDEGLSFRGGRRRSVSASTSFEEVDEMRRADGGEEVVRLSFSNESMRSEYEGGSEGGHGGGSDLGHEFVADQQQLQLRQLQQQEAEPRLSTSTNSCGSSAWHSSTLSHSTSWSSSSAHSSSWSSSWSSSLASSTSTSAYSPSSSYFPPVPQTTTTTTTQTPTMTAGYPFDSSSSLSSLIPIATATATATATTAVPIPTPMVQSSESISSSSLHSLHIVPTSPSSDISSSWSSPTTPHATTMNASSSSAFLQVPEPPSLQVTPPTPLSAQESLAEKFGSLVSVASASDSMMETTEHGQLATIAHHDTSSLRSLTPTPTAPTFVINLGVEDEDGSEMGGLERTEGGLGVRASLKPKRESSRHSRRWSSTDKFAQWAQQWTDKADPLRSFAAFAATTTTAGNEGDANESEEHASMANKAKSRKSALDKLIGAGTGTGDDSSVRTKPMSIHGGSEASSEEPTTTTNPIPAKRLRNDLWENDGIVPVFSQMHPSDCADGHCRHHGTLLLRNGGMKPHRANKSTSSLGAAGTGTGTGANGTGASTTSLVPSPIATSCPGTPMQDTFAAPRPSTSSIQSATADGGNGSGSASASRLRRSFTFDRRSFDLTSFFSSNGSGSGSADRGTHVGSGGGSLGGNENAGGTMALGSADALRIGMLERGVWHVFHTPGMAHNCLVGGLARYEQQRTELWKKIAETVKDLDMAAAAAKLSAATTTSPSTLSSPTSSPTV